MIYDRLIIGVDYTKGKDLTVLAVGYNDELGKTNILRTIVGKEAEFIYELLTNESLPIKPQKTSFYEPTNYIREVWK